MKKVKLLEVVDMYHFKLAKAFATKGPSVSHLHTALKDKIVGLKIRPLLKPKSPEAMLIVLHIFIPAVNNFINDWVNFIIFYSGFGEKVFFL